MSQFRWQTEGDDPWNEEDWTDKAKKAEARRRPWLALILVALIAVVSGAVISRRVDSALESATAEVADDLLSSHQLLVYAVAQDDEELFTTLLSGRNPIWTQAQRDLFTFGQFLDRRAFGLTAVTAGGGESDDLSAEEPSITFSPNLASGEVVSLRSFRVSNSDSLTETVTLEETAVYRRGESRWLLAPPESEFWGSTVRFRGEILDMEYPERDSQDGERLAGDLDAALTDFCAFLADGNCPVNFRLELRLGTSPDSLLALGDPSYVYQPGSHLDLPTLTLVGRPVDEAGYQALRRGYFSLVASRMNAALTGWNCCAHAALFQVLVDYQLSQLGMVAWPVTVDDFRAAVNAETDMAYLARFWSPRNPDRLTREDGWLAYTLVDFLLRRFPERPAVELQRQLSPRLTFESWLRILYGEFGGDNGRPVIDWLSDEWWADALTIVSQSLESPPIPLPFQDLTVFCTPGRIDMPTRLYRYQSSSDKWEAAGSYPGFFFFASSLPDGRLLASGVTFAEEDTERWQSMIMGDDQLFEILDADTSAMSLGQTDPTGRFLVMLVFTNDSGLPTEAAMADLTVCPNSRCDLLPIAGTPIWSPDGRRTLLIDVNSVGQEPLRLGDGTLLLDSVEQTQVWRLYRAGGEAGSAAGGDEPKFLGLGSSPFWLDNETYGYLRVPPESSQHPDQELVLASAGDDMWRPVLDLADVRAALPDNPLLANLFIDFVTADPARDGRLYLVVLSREMGMHYLIQFDLESERLQLLAQLASFSGTRLSFSPDGRWLAFSGVEPEPGGSLRQESQQAVTILIDLQGGEGQRYQTGVVDFQLSPSVSWSADGRWLALKSGERLLSLVAPEVGYQRYLVMPGQCAQPIWGK